MGHCHCHKGLQNLGYQELHEHHYGTRQIDAVATRIRNERSNNKKRITKLVHAQIEFSTWWRRTDEEAMRVHGDLRAQFRSYLHECFGM